MNRSCLTVFFIWCIPIERLALLEKALFPAGQNSKVIFQTSHRIERTGSAYKKERGRWNKDRRSLSCQRNSGEPALSKLTDNAGLLMEGRAFPVKEVL